MRLAGITYIFSCTIIIQQECRSPVFLVTTVVAGSIHGHIYVGVQQRPSPACFLASKLNNGSSRA